MSTSIQPGETNAAKLTVYFPIYDVSGNLCSGEGTPGTTSVVTFASGDVKVEHERGGYSNCAGTVAHNASGEYYYIFDVTEAAASLAEGTIAVRFAKTGYRTVTVRVDFRYPYPGSMIKPNSLEDKCVYSSSKLTSSRLRVFATPTALAAATPGNTDNTDSEIERFVSAVTYNMDGTIATFTWTRQL